LCDKRIILEQFKSKEDYKKFVLDYADHQRKLEEIKHLLLEEIPGWQSVGYPRGGKKEGG